MLQLAWRGVRHNPGRYLATLVAIAMGVGFYAATGFLADRVVASLEGDSVRRYATADAVVAAAPDDSQESSVSQQITISNGTLDAVRNLDGVTAAAGEASGVVSIIDGDDVKDATGRLWIADDELNPVDVTDGQAPAASDEVALDRRTADRLDAKVGSSVTLISADGETPFEVVGITDFGESGALDQNGTVSLHESVAFDMITDGVAEYNQIVVRSESVSQTDLTAAISGVISEDLEAVTGDAFVERAKNEVGQIGNLLKRALQAFAVLALLVGAFVIFNTFSVIVVQRLKELAVLRAIGATPRQVRWSLRTEGLVIGLLGSILGVLGGVGLALLMDFLLGLFGVTLPGKGVKVSPFTVATGIALGTVITVISVAIPASRAARTEPIEAMRDAAVEPKSFTQRRLITTAVLAGIGSLLMLFGPKGWMIGIGLLLVFIAAIFAGPILAVGIARLLGPLLARLGLEGRLATDSTARNPQRTATTANALLIGVFLVTLVSVAGANLRTWAIDALKDVESADYTLVTNQGALGDEVIDGLGAIDGVENVVTFSHARFTIEGAQERISAGDLAAMAGVASLPAASGDLSIEPGSIALLDPAASGAAPVGSEVTVVGPDGQATTLTVAALLDFSEDTANTGSLVHPDTFAELGGKLEASAAFVRIKPNPPQEVPDEIDALIERRHDIDLVGGNQIGQIIGGILSFVINAINGLLLLSVLVAVVGIINTMSLSVIERRRELGLLRVVGMTDTRVQRMVRLESILVSTLGTVSGLVLGLFGGWAIVRAVNRSPAVQIGFSPQIGRLLLVLVIGVVLGYVASLIPARRSTRLDVLDSLAAT